MSTSGKKSVGKRNSRGDIVRKEVVTVTKKVYVSTKAQKEKLQRPPTAFPSDTIPNPKFPKSPVPNKDTNRNPKFSLSPVPNKVHPLSKFEREIPPRGSERANMNQQEQGFLLLLVPIREEQRGGKIFNGNAKNSNVDEFEGVTPPKGSHEDTNSEESETRDLSSEESEAGDTNSEESEVEDINSEESEVEDMSSEESESEDINSEESETEDINSEESSEAEDSDDDEPPMKLVDLDRMIRNLPTARKLMDIDRSKHNLLAGRKLKDIDRMTRNLSTGRKLVDLDRSMRNLSMKR